MAAGTDRQSVGANRRSAKQLLCMGEALLDRVEQTAPGPVKEYVGGSLLNVACVLARLGCASYFASWWGNDRGGKLIEQHL